MPRGQARAGIGDREPDLKHAGEREAEEKEQQRHDCNKARRLELETPTQLASSSLESQQQGDHGPERNQDPQGVNEPVGTHPAMRMTGSLHQGEALDEKHRKDAGHEVEDDPAQEGQRAETEQGNQARGRHSTHGSRQRAGWCVDLVRSPIVQHEHAIQLGWLRVEVFVLFEGDLYPTLDRLHRLRRGIHDLALFQRKELGIGGRVAGEGQGESAGG